MSWPADDEAIARAARDDPAAFGVLYQRYAQAVFGYAYRWLGSADAAATPLWRKAAAPHPVRSPMAATSTRLRIRFRRIVFLLS